MAGGVAAAQEVPESRVKAAYLTRFPAYVEWPPDVAVTPNAPYAIGVIGADDVLVELQKMQGSGRVQGGHAVVVRKFMLGDDPDELHVLYLGRTANVQAVMPALRSRPVLLVTDGAGGDVTGGAIHFVRVDGKVRFVASPAVAERAGLKLSARLLAVAERVVAP